MKAFTAVLLILGFGLTLIGCYLEYVSGRLAGGLLGGIALAMAAFRFTDLLIARARARNDARPRGKSDIIEKENVD